MSVMLSIGLPSTSRRYATERQLLAHALPHEVGDGRGPDPLGEGKGAGRGGQFVGRRKPPWPPVCEMKAPEDQILGPSTRPSWMPRVSPKTGPPDREGS